MTRREIALVRVDDLVGRVWGDTDQSARIEIEQLVGKRNGSARRPGEQVATRRPDQEAPWRAESSPNWEWHFASVGDRQVDLYLGEAVEGRADRPGSDLNVGDEDRRRQLVAGAGTAESVGPAGGGIDGPSVAGL